MRWLSLPERYWWIKFREHNELLFGRRFALRLRGSVYEIYVKPAILYRSEALCLNEKWQFYKCHNVAW